MTPFVLIAGSLFRRPEQRLSKNGKFFTTTTVKVVVGAEFQFWNVIAFSDAAQAELLRLEEGDPVSVQGCFKAEIREYAGEKRISYSMTVDHVLALRQPPRPREENAVKPPAPKPSPGPVRPAFDDDVPF